MGQNMNYSNRSGHKYNAKRTEVDGIKFASMAEARRYQELKLLECAGKIRNLRLQVSYPIDVNGMKICRYQCDFEYQELHKRRWVDVVEDVKGFKTPAYNLKRKLMKAVWGIEIRETK